MHKLVLILIFFSLSLVSAGAFIGQREPAFAGEWYAVMKAPAGEMPFVLKLHREGESFSGELSDGHHKVVLENFKLADGKLTFGIDDARIRFEVTEHAGTLNGSWRRKGKTSMTELPFTATHNKPAASDPKQAANFFGEWKCIAKEDGKETPILLMIRSEGGHIEGTGIDPTGDFGQMRGQVNGDQLTLSRFDGQSISLVVAKVEGKDLRAAVSTSPSGQFEITGAREGTALPDPGSVAKVNTGLHFDLPTAQGEKVNFPGDKFKGKVVIVNIMGTWCHNCHDETPFLVEFYQKYHNRGLEVVSLCYEAQATEDEDRNSILKYQQSHKIPYTMVYAGRVEAGPSTQLAGLEKFGGYPTNIFVGRDGQIAATHTGFWGPATGEKYQTVKREFEETVQKLLGH